jgi:hypothetical protein
MATHYCCNSDAIGEHVAVFKKYLLQKRSKILISFLDAQKLFLNGHWQEATEEFASACIAYISCCHKYGFDVVGQEIEQINATMNVEKLLTLKSETIDNFETNLKIIIHAEEKNKEMREHIVHILVEFQSGGLYHYFVYAFRTWLDKEKMTQELEDFKKNTNSLSCVIKRSK